MPIKMYNEKTMIGNSFRLWSLEHGLVTWPKGHLDLDESFVTVSKQILGLPVVDSHHSKEQMA